MSFEMFQYTGLWIWAILDILAFVILFRQVWSEFKKLTLKHFLYVIVIAFFLGPLICFLYAVDSFMEIWLHIEDRLDKVTIKNKQLLNSKDN